MRLPNSFLVHLAHFHVRKTLGKNKDLCGLSCLARASPSLLAQARQGLSESSDTIADRYARCQLPPDPRGSLSCHQPGVLIRGREQKQGVGAAQRPRLRLALSVSRRLSGTSPSFIGEGAVAGACAATVRRWPDSDPSSILSTCGKCGQAVA